MHLWFVVRVVAFAALCAFAMMPIAAEAQATLPMIPDRSGSIHPVVGVSASGVPLVNIVAPNQAGVSLNNFAHYNVGTQGAVIVNTPRSTQTQIAGWVPGNPLMGNAPARLIINQVTTGNPTRLLGMTEIAGHRANLIVANPAGITCAGCGFINIPRISLTTGRPSFNADGSLAGFDVVKGRLAIDGSGLDARGSAIDLIARAMRINGQIWADTIRATAGANEVAYANGAATVQPGEGETPSVAIDVLALGGMYANSVRLIGTEAGVGVRSSGVIDSLSGDIEVSSKGDVTIEAVGRTQAARNTRIETPNLTNRGAIVSSETVHLDTAATFRNEGVVAAQFNVDIVADEVRNGGDILAGIDASSVLSGPGSISLTGGTLSSEGLLAAGDNVNVTGAFVSLDTGTVSAGSALNVNGAEALTMRDATAHALNATLKSNGALINDGGMLLVAGEADIEARRVSNRDGMVAGDMLTVNVGDVDNTGGMLAGRHGAKIRSATLVNTDGNIGTTVDVLHLSARAGLFNDRGRIIGADGLSLDAGRLASNRHGEIGTARGDADVRIDFDTNNDRGTILSGQRLKVVVDEGTLSNDHGRVVSGDALDVAARSLASNVAGHIVAISGAAVLRFEDDASMARGFVASAGDLSVKAARLDNRDGTMHGRQVELDVESLNNESGEIGSVADLIVRAKDSVSNGNGALVAGAALTATSAEAIGNIQGKIWGGGDVELISAGLDNTAGTVSGADVTLKTGDETVVNALGVIAALGQLESESGRWDNRSGLIHVRGSAKLDTRAAVFDNSTSEGAAGGGRVIVQGATLATGVLKNDGGLISSSDAAYLTGESISNDRGAILSLGQLRMESAGEISNVAGQIGGDADVAIDGARVDNTGGAVHAGQALTVTGDAIVNAQTRATRLSPASMLEPLQAGIEGATVSLTASGDIDNVAGAIRSGETTKVRAKTIENSGGEIGSSGRVTAIASGTVTNTVGEINGGEAIELSSIALMNDGRIESRGDVGIEVAGQLTNFGRILAGGDLNVGADNVTNGGALTARGVVGVSGQNIDNQVGGEIAGDLRTTVRASQSLTNEGLIDGGRTRVDAIDTVANRGRLYGDSVSIGARTVRNDVDRNGTAAAIASRGNIDIGAKLIENLGGSLIYASNDMRSAASLDENGGVSDTWSDRFTNKGAVIDAGGRVEIAANRFENLNANFQTERITTDAGKQLWYTIAGSTERIDPSSVHFYQPNTQEAKPGADYRWALDDDQKFLLLPSGRYPSDEFARYTINGVAGKIDNVYYPSLPAPVDRFSATASESEPAGLFRSVPAEMWAKFGIEPPPSPPNTSYIKTGDFSVHSWLQHRRLGPEWYTLDVPIVQSQRGGSLLPERQTCLTAVADSCASFRQWYESLTRSYGALGRAVADYNRDVASRTIPTWTIYDLDVKSTKDIVTATQPGTIMSGGGMTISARSGVNDKSQLLAGGHAYLKEAIQDNSQPKGLETFEGVGTAIGTWVESGGAFRGDERKHSSQYYAAPLPPKEIDLPITAVTPTNRDPVKRIAADTTITVGLSDVQGSGADARSVGSLERLGVSGSIDGGALLEPKRSSTAIAHVKLGPIEIRTVEPNVKLPSNALYQVVSDPGSRHLIETDSRFTNNKGWLSSEKMIAALTVDPSTVQKRLGDGFYEQQLVQQQIVQATGQRFIGNYTDNQAAYQALMANGVRAAQRFGMNVGTALTDAQMAALTEDIVWLVNRSVELPDGSLQTVLVPQVYFRANAADVTGTGAIVAGESVALNNQTALVNSGTILSRTITVITADSITNVGAVAGRTVQVEAKRDLTNRGGTVQGNNIDLSAGRDVSLAGTMQSATTANGSANEIDRLSHINAGTLSVRAGRDLNLNAAQVVSSGDVSLTAQRDVTLLALRASHDDHVRWDEKNRAEHSRSIEVGTAIDSGGDVGIVAGRDFAATAASVSAQGNVSAVAGRDINLHAGERSASAYDEHSRKESGILSSKSTHTIDASSYTDAIGTILSGNTVAVAAGNNFIARAATIAGTGDVLLEAGQDLTITTAETASSEYHFRDVKKSGLGTAGPGISYGTNQTIDTSLEKEKGSRGSLIGSIEGSVSLHAGNKLHVTGADVVAEQDVAGVGKEVRIDASKTDRHRHETHEVKSSGFTLAVKSTVTDAMQNVNQQAHGAGKSEDGRAAALHAIAAAGGMADLVGAAGGMTGALAGGGKPEGKIELSFGSSRSKSTYTHESTQHNGSHIKAGGRVAFVAAGETDSGQGNITIEGSRVAGNDVLLNASNKINLVSSTDTERVRSTNESQSASVGVSFGTNGWGVSAAMSRADGYANSDATMQNNTQIAARNTATIVSGGDTDIVGANLSARKVIAAVGGNLNIASVQDTVRSVAQQRSVGGGFSVSQGGGSASFSIQNGRASGSYAGVSEQSGIQAGDRGFDITVKGNTDLKGAYIASVAAPEENRLSTGTLSFADVHNSSGYDASSVGVGAGGGVGDGGNDYATHGASTGKNVGGGLPLRVSESHGSQASTRSAISGGRITIGNEARQKQDIALLNRDAMGLNGEVEALPDLQNVLSTQSDLIGAAQASAETVAKQIGAYADARRASALDAAKREADPKLKESHSQEAKNWGEGGAYRVALHLAGGALTGGLTGGGTGAVGGAVGAGLSAKLAPHLKEVARSIREAGPTGNDDVDQLLGNVASNLLAGGAAAVVGGSTGALMGAATDRFNRQLGDDEKKLAKQLTEKSGAKYSQDRIEDQQRIMNVSVNGEHESGAPTTLIGEAPTDAGAKWISGGVTVDGKPILTQVTAQADPELQNFILANNHSASPDQVPSIYTYDRPKNNDWGFALTGPFIDLNKADVEFARNTTADSMSMVSKNAGRLSSITAAAASVPSPYAPGLAAVSYGATVMGLTADAIAQVARPDMGEYAYGGALTLGAKVASDRVPLAAPIINEAVASAKTMPFSERIRSWINGRWRAVAIPTGRNE
ncbi:hemagglutinin repeat-containing protein [Trinickia sp. NRRL B-1857]|uniref:two-partner secretion domain-containing protein n=1 Tax=Trinickia sp. NRRL B-1857 TaxID=3162879 RepID=UPI003D2B7DD9